MKVKLLVSRAGPFFSQNAGEIIEVDDAEGKRLIASDQAEPVQKETATKKQPVKTATKK